MIWYNDGWNDPFTQLPDDLRTIYGLVLNPMRGRTEEQRLVALSDSRQEIEDLLRNERVEPYSDPGKSDFGGATTWRKVFRKGGPIEWFNPPEDVSGAPGIVELRRDGWRRVA